MEKGKKNVLGMSAKRKASHVKNALRF